MKGKKDKEHEHFANDDPTKFGIVWINTSKFDITQKQTWKN